MSDMLTGVYMGGGGNNSWVLTIPWLLMNEVKEKVKRGFFFFFSGWKNLTGALIMEEIFRLEDNGYLLSQKPITRKHLSNGKILIYVI